MFTIISRTAEQKADLGGSWSRPDEEFFTAGACHILAGVFLETYPNNRFQAWMIRPSPGFRGGHVVVSDGSWIFDGRGWYSKEDYLRRYAESCQAIYPGWTYRLENVDEVLGWDFCRAYHHRHPSQFFADPILRAKTFLRQFSPPAFKDS